MPANLLFALDIGTRNVVGIVAEVVGSKINILASERLEHQTRAMLDGQIHDIPQVVLVIKEIKEKLEAKINATLTKATVAAAGRALLTIESSAELETYSTKPLTLELEQSLEILAVQNAQQHLAKNNLTNLQQNYYCVGYNVSNYLLDDNQLATLVGQRGAIAKINIIATFLPKQVVDSLETALSQSGLHLGGITLEPIAAINFLIPPTMRHLNIALIDIGAGTSDIAITAQNSVIGFGMVPCAGDEITEALSQHYLLDFNDAELIKRNLSSGCETVAVTDILGYSTEVTCQEIAANIAGTINDLADKITQEILRLNSKVPQAVILIGGGALTPNLTDYISEKLALPKNKIGIRQPMAGTIFTAIPEDLMTPEAITPLGILKLANSNYLNFISLTINNNLHRIFNLGTLTVGDALLAIGLDVQTMKGRPGLGIALTVNSQRKFIAGSHGTDGVLTVNDQPADLKTILQEDDNLQIHKGSNGEAPNLKIKDLIEEQHYLAVQINGKSVQLEPLLFVNELPATSEQPLLDGDNIYITPIATLTDLLSSPFITEYLEAHPFTINEESITYTSYPEILINGKTAQLTSPLSAADKLSIIKSRQPSLAEVLALNTAADQIQVYFGEHEVSLNKFISKFTVNDQEAVPEQLVADHSCITYERIPRNLIVSDVLDVADFKPQELPAGKNVTIYLNNKAATLIQPIKNGDEVTVVVSDL